MHLQIKASPISSANPNILEEHSCIFATHDDDGTRQQKKKVHDLGELPALDWNNASAKLLLMITVVGIILFTLYSGWLDECVQIGELCLRVWLNSLCVAIGGYFLTELLAKVRQICTLLP